MVAVMSTSEGAAGEAAHASSAPAAEAAARVSARARGDASREGAERFDARPEEWGARVDDRKVDVDESLCERGSEPPTPSRHIDGARGDDDAGGGGAASRASARGARQRGRPATHGVSRVVVRAATQRVARVRARERRLRRRCRRCRRCRRRPGRSFAPRVAGATCSSSAPARARSVRAFGALLGARSVTMTDRDEATLAAMHANARLNGRGDPNACARCPRERSTGATSPPTTPAPTTSSSRRMFFTPGALRRPPRGTAAALAPGGQLVVACGLRRAGLMERLVDAWSAPRLATRRPSRRPRPPRRRPARRRRDHRRRARPRRRADRRRGGIRVGRVQARRIGRRRPTSPPTPSRARDDGAKRKNPNPNPKMHATRGWRTKR